MGKVEIGGVYLYRSLTGQAYNVEVMKIRGSFALCEYRITHYSFNTYRTTAIHWKPKWRLM